MVGSTLEDLVAGAVVTGIDPAGPITVVTAQWHGTQAVTLVYRDHASQVREQMDFRGLAAFYRDRFEDALIAGILGYENIATRFEVVESEGSASVGF